jgi:glucosylceramidase
VHRIQRDVGSSRTVTNLAFLNPDGMLVLVVVNHTPKPQAFRVVARGLRFVAEVPDRTVATCHWSSRNTD